MLQRPYPKPVYQLVAGLATAEIHTVPRAIGMVYLVLQIHHSPTLPETVISGRGKEVVGIQKQITDITNLLHYQAGARLLMLEGVPYGMPKTNLKYFAEYRARLEKAEQCGSAAEAFAARINTAKTEHSFPAGFETAVIKKMAAMKDSVYMEDGALYAVAKAPNDYLIEGLEDWDIFEKADNALQRMIELNFRRKELIQEILGQQEPARPESLEQEKVAQEHLHEMATLKTESLRLTDPGNKQLADQLYSCYQSFPVVSDPTAANSRNRYRDIKDPKVLKKLILETVLEYDDLAITQRNKAAAQNIARALTARHQNRAIAVLGSAHEDGLTKELNALGCSVTIIRPTLVGPIKTRRK